MTQKITSNGKPNPRLLLDVTIAATTDLNTGIQRVVRNIAHHAEKTTADLGYECKPVVCHGNQLSAVGFDGRARWDERFFRFVAQSWMGMHRGFAKVLSTFRREAGKKYLSFLSRLRKLFVPKTLVRGVTNTYRKWTGRSIEIRKDDVLILLDASWDLPLEEILDEAKTKDVPVVTVVYDLIPVLHPNFHQEQLKVVFAKWLEMVLQNSDMMIGISETVRDDVHEFSKSSGLENKNCVFESFRLGSDFQPQKAAIESSSKIEKKLGNSKGYYLAVGTIEPRKNHEFLLDTFEQLWANGSNSTLVIAGKIGWMCEAIADRIQSHPQLDNKLFHFDDATDDELVYFYQNAKALLFPSIVEGFGLPIVEAFQFGTPVLASNTRIHREVAGDNAIYFELDSIHELVSQLQKIDAGQMELTQPDFEVYSWADSCAEFFAKINRLVQSGKNETPFSEPASSQPGMRVA